MKNVPTGNPRKARAFPFYAVGVGFEQRGIQKAAASMTTHPKRYRCRNLTPQSTVAAAMMWGLTECAAPSRGSVEGGRQWATSGVGVDVVSVCAAVFVREVGTAPPSSSHRWISPRGSLCRSRCLRRSSDTPSTSAPIDRSPTVQFIRRFRFLYGSAQASTNHSCRARATFSPGYATTSTVARQKEIV